MIATDPKGIPKSPLAFGSHVGTIFRSWALLDRILRVLLRLFSLLAGFCAFLGSPGSILDGPGSILEGSGTLRGGFWRFKSLIFQSCCSRARLHCAEAADMQKPRKNTGFSYVVNTSRLLRTRQTTTQNRSRSLSNRASHEDRAKNSSWGSSGSILEGSGALLGTSWASLGRLLAALGRLLVPLGRLLGASWALLGRSLASLGWSDAPVGCILAPRNAPGLDFGGFGDVPGWVLYGFGGMFWHAVCFASRFIT